MVSDARPKRQRRAPTRFGELVGQDDWEEESEASQSDFEVQSSNMEAEASSEGPSNDDSDRAGPSSGARGGRKRMPSAAASESDGGSEEEDEEGCQHARAPGRVAAPADGGRGVADVRERCAPPRQPITADAFLSTLHACPHLLASLAAKDSLRTVSLAARDIGNLAVAVGAHSATTNEWWRVLASQHAPAGVEVTSDTPLEQALAIIKKVARDDPARFTSVNKSKAKADWRLSDRELAGLSYVQRPNRLFYNAAPVKLYTELDCRAIAHRKYGSQSAIDAGRLKARYIADKAKHTLTSWEDERREELSAALQAVGLDIATWRVRRRKDVKGYIKRGTGHPPAIAAAIVAEDRAQQEVKERQQLLAARAGLPPTWEARHFVESGNKADLEKVVASIKAAQRITSRRAELDALLEKEGLTHYTYRAVAADDYVNCGQGTAEDVVAACIALRDKQQQKQARRDSLRARLLAEGLHEHYSYTVSKVLSWVERGEGSEDAAMAAAHAKHTASAARQQALAQRRAQVVALLEAEQLPAGYADSVRDVMKFVSSGQGSAEAFLEAARAHHRQQQERAARQQAVEQLLAAEGLPATYAAPYSVRLLWDYVCTGVCSEAAALEAARTHHARVAGRPARLAAVTAALQPHGIELAAYRYEVEALSAWLDWGEGSEEAAVDAARSEKMRREQGYLNVWYDDGW